MEDQIIKIAKNIQQNGLNSSNHGLLNGNTGISIFFYHLAHETGNPDYEKVADDFLDKAFSNLSSSAPVDFENGLAGIGWGIEYLVQNNFAEGDTNEILEEVDNKVFRSLHEENHTSFELTTGLTGYLFYLINRLKNYRTLASMSYRINRELLILTINKIEKLVTTQFPSVVKDANFDLLWRFPAMFSGLKEALELNIYNEKIKCMIKQWLPYFEAYLPSLHINRLFLAVTLNRIFSKIPDNRLEKQIQILLFATDFGILKTEVNHKEFNLRLGWPGVLWIHKVAKLELSSDSPNYELIKKSYLDILEKHIGTLKNQQLNFTDRSLTHFGPGFGLAGIGILELLYPGILAGNI